MAMQSIGRRGASTPASYWPERAERATARIVTPVCMCGMESASAHTHPPRPRMLLGFLRFKTTDQEKSDCNDAGWAAGQHEQRFTLHRLREVEEARH